MKDIIDSFILENKLEIWFLEGQHYPCYRTPKEVALRFIAFLKEHKDLRFTILTDLFAVDFPEKPKRFEIVYNLLSLQNNTRIIVKAFTADREHMPSISKVFSASIWYEREIFDMFGVRFDGNPDLRRILTDYGFTGHPLRKDFPVSGYVQVRYDSKLEKVVNEPVKLQQAFREFDFLTPWQGPKYILPGDEKATQNK
ncbi:MAG: NADH-quinone oxidoreductase subunit C [Alphaproteobacteria bacterium]|nr:NADH-quinone oxidoreductase subunit C [Alphaproteobacteria bacterium]